MTTPIRDKFFQVDPYTQLEMPPNYKPDLQGWNSNSIVFKDILEEIKPQLVCEVGTWKGGSAATIAEHASVEELVCVDTWLGSEEFWKEPDRERGLARFCGYPTVYYTFLRNMKARGLNHRVTPFPATSATAARLFKKHGFKFDLIYIDGSHDSSDVCQDIVDYIDLTPVILGDDWDWGSVRDGIEHACYRLLTLPLDLEVRGEKWILRRK